MSAEQPEEFIRNFGIFANGLPHGESPNSFRGIRSAVALSVELTHTKDQLAREKGLTVQARAEAVATPNKP